MILIIDTVSDEKYLALMNQDFVKRKILSNNVDLTCELERKVKSLISKKILKQIDRIVVNSGPGGFTATRSGVSFANALAFALKIPIISVKKQPNLLRWAQKNYLKIIKILKIQFAKPYYSQKPKITKPGPFLKK
jgi:tRNA A37 threonylcarbamoyladenosine modification protein TsaB